MESYKIEDSLNFASVYGSTIYVHCTGKVSLFLSP